MPTKCPENPSPSSLDRSEHARACDYLCDADAMLAPWIEAVGPYRPGSTRRSSTFAALLRAIVYQQLSGKAANAIHQRVLALFAGHPAKDHHHRLLDLDEMQLRGAGLSRSKILALQDLAQKSAEGEIPSKAKLRRMHDAEVIENLTRVRGIGQWTVEMMLMSMLERPDVMPATDLGIRKGFQRVYQHDELPPPGAILAHSERWRPYRTVASWYLWRSLEVEL